jgi:hypothetical protein
LFDLLGQLLQQGVDITGGFIGILAAVTANRLLKSLAVEGAGAGTCSAAGSMGGGGDRLGRGNGNRGGALAVTRASPLSSAGGAVRMRGSLISVSNRGHNSTSLKRSANS